MRGYVSETTQFLRDLLAKNPNIVEKQAKHRATWWDRPQNYSERKALEEAKMPQKGYVYYHNP